MVEWKKIEEVCTVLTGGDAPRECAKGQLEPTMEYPYPIYSNGDEIYGFCSTYRVNTDAVTISSIGNVGSVFYRAANFTPIIRLKVVIPSTKLLRTRFLYYSLLDYSFVGTNSSLSSMKAADIKRILIPIPSLSEQTRIVGILDTFTSSIDNLKEQIAQRRKQYEYYRDQLLDLEGKEGVERLTLKDVCEVINGRAYSQPELLSEGKYRVLRVGNFFSNDNWYYSDLELDNKFYCEKGDLLYAWSASFGPHIWNEEKVIYHYHIWKMDCSNRIHRKFMFYWLQSDDLKKQAFTNLHGATMAHLTKALIESLQVPVPSLSEQQRIVSILDTFEASIANLEAQLKQREKQYEYYRNKLLTFE